MLACQYVFDLPEAYEMQAVRDRVAEKGRVFDDWPGLRLKLFLLDEPARGGTKRYATLYVWRSAEALRDFLVSPAFAGVSGSFGRRPVRTWLVDALSLPTQPPASLIQAGFDLPPGGNLAESMAEAAVWAEGQGAGHAVLLDPTAWQAEVAVFSSGRRAQATPGPGDPALRTWEVLHASMPADG